jgi:crotonobetainyl-CoA:carnitine CoA-transferase CaiB-like acyl-CoA transferase
VLAHPQTDALGMLQPVPGHEVPLVGLPLCFDGVRPPIRRAPPRIGEHNDEILAKKEGP